MNSFPAALIDRKHLGRIVIAHEVGLDRDALRGGVTEDAILVPDAWPVAADEESLPGAHEGGVAHLLEFTEQRGDGNLQGPCERSQSGQRRRDRAVLDLRQHAGREPRPAREFDDAEAWRPCETRARLVRSRPQGCRSTRFRRRSHAPRAFGCGLARAGFRAGLGFERSCFMVRLLYGPIFRTR